MDEKKVEEFLYGIYGTQKCKNAKILLLSREILSLNQKPSSFILNIFQRIE